jgi:hypothetical protein
MHTRGLQLEYVEVREVEGILVFTGTFTEARRLFATKHSSNFKKTLQKWKL